MEKEKIVEKVIDWITLNSGGRIVVFRPENSSADLVVEKRGNYKDKTISLNIYSKDQFGKIKPDNKNNFYLLFVDFDIVKQDIDDEIFVVAPEKPEKILLNKKDLSDFFIQKLG